MDSIDSVLWGDVVPVALALAGAVVTLLCLWHCYRAHRPTPRAKATTCEEDAALDRLAKAVDDALGALPPKRPTGPANRIEREGMFHGPRARRL